ncbi:MerR family transcriptional regulator [Humibacter ginsenosidimutans]|nr:MerR family transcriptional regulator [Humibacter ginsenosidimutans]
MEQGSKLHSIREVADAFGMAVSALRYYDELGVLPATERRGGVRYYDERSLAVLAYVQLLHDDAMLPLDRTQQVIDARTAGQRAARLRGGADALRENAERMLSAADMLDHLSQCPARDPLTCPVTGAELDRRVERAMANGMRRPSTRMSL